MTTNCWKRKLFASARSAMLTLAFIMATPDMAVAQGAPAPGAPPIDQMGLAKLIWSTMAAVDHGNQTGNYSVLRDLGAPGFQINNDAAKLGQIFANLRASGTDLSNTLLLAPGFRSQPRMVQADMLQIQGFFGLRPTAINFELIYQWVGGKWRLFGVAISPSAMSTGEENTPQPLPSPKRK